MSCNLTSGRKVACKSSVGGIKTVYFADYGTLGDATIVGGEITALNGPVDWYQFDLKGNSTLETTINSSRENGTTFYETTLTLNLPYLDLATQEQIKILAFGRPHIAVEDYNGNLFLVGLENGGDVNGGSISTGATMGDLSGSSLTFVAQEKTPPYFVDSGVINGDTTQIDPTA
jgi:hypothetical protein